MSHRIFIALFPSLQLTKEIYSWMIAHVDYPVRWINKENLHVTLVPPWQVDNPQAAMNTFRKLTVPPTVPLSFQSVALGPSAIKPRLLWSIGPVTPQLESISAIAHQAFGTSQKTANTAVRQSFIPHMTLARLSKSADLAEFTELPVSVSWSGHASSIALVASLLLPSGAQYSILHAHPLS